MLQPVPGATVSADGHTAILLAGAGADANEMVKAADDLIIDDTLTPTMSVGNDLDSLLAVSNILSIHCPSTAETRKSINAETLAKLPHGDGLHARIVVLGGGPGADLVTGDRGDDFLEGGPGFDRLFGGFGDDLLFGMAGHDELYGEEGDDELYGGISPDILDGGAGTNLLDYGPEICEGGHEEGHEGGSGGCSDGGGCEGH